MISIRSLNKYFNKGSQNEIHVINNASLELPEKGMVAIFGKSGCGKTTLLNVIGGLDSFQSGSLLIDGQDIGAHTDTVRNQLTGYIFQNYNLNKAESCFDNVADALRLCGMTDKQELEERTMAALANVGMERYHARTPDTLSGGQQQRIAIARAIVKNPHIILADEPTGNLDEANTILIMDLLKEISRDHLVLLVTHEANLVDYYCDTVIELQDGKIVGTRNNTDANGFSARDKNDIYLGELKHTELSNANAEIEYFGEQPEEPIRLRIVNNGGKFYIQVRTPKVQVLDETSEVRLREGSYEHAQSAKAQQSGFDMSKLPPIKGTSFGKLFSFRSSVKSGYQANFHQRKKGKKLLLRCMALFSAILVLMTALFGTSFKKLIDIGNSYNHNVFYLYTPDGNVSDQLIQALSTNTGIDYIRLQSGYPGGDDQIGFMTGFFESFTQYMDMNSFSTNAVFLENSLAKELPLVAGKNTSLESNELIISTAVADALLDKSSLGYIHEYQDLIGLITTRLTADGKNLQIAGVVRSGESAIYLTERAMAQYVLGQFRDLCVAPAADFHMTVADGETVFLYRPDSDSSAKLPGKTVKISGKEFNVTAIKQFTTDYSEWLEINGIKVPGMDEWAEQILHSEQPDLVKDTQEYNDAISQILGNRVPEYYLEAYYSHIDEFIRDVYLYTTDFYLWAYCDKGIETLKFYYMQDSDLLYATSLFREQNGRYPTSLELAASSDSWINAFHAMLEQCEDQYLDEYCKTFQRNSYAYMNRLYLVSDADYIALSKRVGETDPTAISSYSTEKYPDTEYVPGYDPDYDSDFGIGYDSRESTAPLGKMVYTVIHSTDPAKTEEYLKEHFSSLSTGNSRYETLLTPGMIYDSLIEDQRTEIFQNLLTMVILLALMSVCMYFIMRSSLMNRIKEVGIYRAIGVSRQNLIFRFLVEALVLTTLTVFVGFLISSAVIWAWLGLSSLMSSLFFYPLWLAGILLAILYVICLFCGTVPILTLLRKTPSEILAKYDI